MANQGWPEDGKWLTPVEQQQLFREWREDYGQVHLRDREIRYEDEQKEMLKPDNPAWTELVADIKAVLSNRSGDEDTFASLHRSEQWDFFRVSGFIAHYLDQGMTQNQVTAVIRNALDGKPEGKWLDGVFDGQTLNLEKKEGTNHLNAEQAGASLQGYVTDENQSYDAMLAQAAKRLGNAKSREREQER